MKVNIEIPEAENFSSIWEPEFKISTSVFSSPKEGQSIAIHANAEGLISLARLFLFLAQPAYSPGKHHHLDMELEAGSVELIIDKT